VKNHSRRTRAALGAVCLAAALTVPLSSQAQAAPAAAVPSIVPKPVSATAGHGRFELTRSTRIVAGSNAATPVAQVLAADLAPATGQRFGITRGRAHDGDIRLVLGNPGALPSEGYRLSVTSHGVTLESPSQHGLFDGVQTILQLLPPWIAHTTPLPGPWTIPAVTVTDYPRYQYRGVMLDIGRHFEPPAAVEKLIDIASAYKVNTLHLHVSDDQGFRIAIKGLPNLTTIGSQGSACATGCTTPDPGGYWTQAQYKGVVAYAAAHFMTVVPEVDTPGHNNAIIMSEYNDTANPLLNGHPQDINCSNSNPPKWNYTWDVGYSALCPASDNTWTIISTIVKQLSAMSSSPYYDLGGDEVQTITPAQYAALVNRESGIVAANGKTPMGWADGYATVAGTTPPAGSIGEAWEPGGTDAVQAVQKGMKVVMAPADHTYLDQSYPAPDKSGLGLGWACGGCDLAVNYGWDPATVTAGVTDKNIIGVEGALWSETLPNFTDAEYLLLPRLLAVAEIAWSPAGARTGPAFQDFASRVAAQGARFQSAGYNFFTTSQVPWRLDLTADVGHGTLALLGAPGVPTSALTAKINWGDGTTTAGTITGTAATTKTVNGLYSVGGHHTYAHGGAHHVTVTVTETNGATATVHLTI
jgi:hexosaminidase